jgi:hypothetical protein
LGKFAYGDLHNGQELLRNPFMQWWKHLHTVQT